MTYGLYETTACIALVVLLWRLPVTVDAITRFLTRNK